MKKYKKWIIAGVIILAIIIAVYLFSNQTSPVDKQIIQAADLSKLSPQDLETYNSLPNDAAKADFLRILVNTNKIPDFGIQPIIDKANANNPSATTTTTQGYDTGKPNFQPDAPIPPLSNVTGIPFVDAIINKFRKPHYKQVQPIDSNGCDANGYDKRGVSCSKISGYTQVGQIDDRGCDENNKNAIGVTCL